MPWQRKRESILINTKFESILTKDWKTIKLILLHIAIALRLGVTERGSLVLCDTIDFSLISDRYYFGLKI